MRDGLLIITGAMHSEGEHSACFIRIIKLRHLRRKYEVSDYNAV